MRRASQMIFVALVALALAGCAKVSSLLPGQNNPGPTSVENADYVSAALPTAYENALPASTQLALGILRLEGTPQAITAAQAKALLSLWQAFQGNALVDQSERNAVMKQIEGELTAEQVQAIAGMQLTGDDMRAWMQEHGVQFLERVPGGQLPEGASVPFGQGERPGNNLTDEQRSAVRATVQASGQGGFAFGGQDAGPRGTPGAPGAAGRRFVAGFAQYRILVQPVVELLTARAAE